MVFTQHAIFRHVLNMTSTATLGLVALFVVEALNLYYIAQLGEAELAAAIGYAGTLLFFVTSLAIGLSIACSAVVSQTLGRGQPDQARSQASAALLLMGIVMTVTSVLLALTWDVQLVWLGARGETAELAHRFLLQVTPSLPLLGLGMGMAALLRALGDGRRAMWVTLGPALVAAVLDPLFIVVLDWRLDGAALTMNVARVVMVVLAWRALAGHHDHLPRPQRAACAQLIRPLTAIGIPAILTQMATPFGNAFVTNELAQYGDSAVAGWAIIGRLITVAFGAIFALSGAIGPIVGQNHGAGLTDRLHEIVRASLQLTTGYVLVVWLLLIVLADPLAQAFQAQGLSRDMVVFFCQFVSLSFIFNGAVFIANAVFNNLGLALYSTILNWTRATLGVLPFVWLGSHWGGALGVLGGYGLGAIVFGVGGIWWCHRCIERTR